jgi:hypothetical protein
MKTKLYDLNKEDQSLIERRDILIELGCYIDACVSYPLILNRNHSIGYNNRSYIYDFKRFGNDKTENPAYDFLKFNFYNHQKFLFIQNKHWLQKEENIRYIVNVVFLIIGAYIGLKKL